MWLAASSRCPQSIRAVIKVGHQASEVAIGMARSSFTSGPRVFTIRAGSPAARPRAASAIRAVKTASAVPKLAAAMFAAATCSVASAHCPRSAKRRPSAAWACASIQIRCWSDTNDRARSAWTIASSQSPKLSSS